MVEKEKTQSEEALKNETERSVDNFDKEETQPEQTEQKKNEKQKEKDATETQESAETLLASLDGEVVKDIYTEKTRKEMLALRDDISAGRIDMKKATKKLENLKKEKQGAEKEKASGDGDLTLRQEAKKWLFMTFLPFGIGKKLADRIKPAAKEDKKEEKEKTGFGWKLLKRTGILAVGAFLGTNLHKLFTKEGGEQPNGEQETPVDAQAPTNTEVIADEQNPAAPETSLEQPTAEQVEQEYQRLYNSHPTFSESFLRAWAIALLMKEGAFQDNGKTYFCYKEGNGDDGVTADVSKYETIVNAQEQELYTDLPDDAGDQLSEEEQQSSTEANATAEELEKEGFNSLYVLMRMYQNGFMPSKAFGFRKIDSLLESQRNMRAWLSKKLIPSVRNNLIIAQARRITDIGDVEYKKSLTLLKNIETDIQSGKIKNVEQLTNNYGKEIELKLKYRDRAFGSRRAMRKVKEQVIKRIESYPDNEKRILELEEQMKKAQNETMKNLEDLKTQAENTKDPKTQKALLEKIQQSTNDYNAKAIDYQTQTGKIMSTMSNADLLKVETRSSVVKTLLKNTGGVNSFIQKTNKYGGKAALGITVLTLIQKGYSDVDGNGVVSWETAKDVGDLGLGMIPVAGGIYDIGIAIAGKDLNGRKLTDKDRLIRAGMGVATTALDVVGFFTLGAGNAAAAGIRGAYRGVKAVDKVVDVAKTAGKVSDVKNVGKGLMKTYKGIRLTTEVMTFATLGYGLHEGVKEVVVDYGKPLVQKVVKEVKIAKTSNVSV